MLSPSKSNEKGVVKRYHLSEFRTPYPPDQDRQELPNSVVLDFVDGRTLQCACETYMVQAQVLQSKLSKTESKLVMANDEQFCEKHMTPGVRTIRRCSGRRIPFVTCRCDWFSPWFSSSLYTADTRLSTLSFYTTSDYITS